MTRYEEALMTPEPVTPARPSRAQAKLWSWAAFGRKLSRRERGAYRKPDPGVWLPPRIRRALDRHLKARNDLDREYQANFPNVPQAFAARYRPEGQVALDREVAKRRAQRRNAARLADVAYLKGADVPGATP